MSATVDYALEPELATAEFIDVLHRSGLAARRPVDEPQRMARMLSQADILVTARIAGRLVGISRAVSDFAFCTYLSDLAVDRACQRQGIGRELVARTHQAAGLETALILLAAPEAAEYYGRIGMQHHDRCWVIPRASTGEGVR